MGVGAGLGADATAGGPLAPAVATTRLCAYPGDAVPQIPQIFALMEQWGVCRGVAQAACCRVLHMGRAAGRKPQQGGERQLASGQIRAEYPNFPLHIKTATTAHVPRGPREGI